MAKVLLLGAGRSVGALVDYLQENALLLNLSLRIGDKDINKSQIMAEKFSGASFFQFDISEDEGLDSEFRWADLVISMLPSHLHGRVAHLCLHHSAHLITASYCSPQIKNLDQQVKDKNLVFLTEMGLDPGIDHMSAMRAIDQLKKLGNKVVSFKSYVGGLIAVSKEKNPWNYKFTWNPRNVVKAGQGVVKFLKQGELKYLGYNSLFRRVEQLDIPELGSYEAYYNRDSLKYIDQYALGDCATVIRGTLRNQGFCEAWDVFVQLGLTDDSFQMKTAGMSYREFLNSFLRYHPSKSVEEKVLDFVGQDAAVFEKIEWLNLFSDQEKVELNVASPAQVLQSVLERKWKFSPEDKDVVVMYHEILFEKNNNVHRKQLSVCVYGDESGDTAMAKTVGLPIGIATKLILKNRLLCSGVLIPVIQEIYEPVLSELKTYGIDFNECTSAME